MKYLLPTLGTIAAVSLFAFSSQQQTAIAVEPSSHSDTFQQLELFADVMSRVRNDYVVTVDDGDLIENAINGMLQSLDPHSSYVSPENFRDLQTSTSGEYGGLGMEVTTEEGLVKVVSPIDDTPAKRAGIKSGDYLTEIDGKSIVGLSLSQAVDQMRGKPGEPITVTVVREGVDPLEITMVREIIKRKVVRHEVKDGIGYLRISQFNEKTFWIYAAIRADYLINPLRFPAHFSTAAKSSQRGDARLMTRNVTMPNGVSCLKIFP